MEYFGIQACNGYVDISGPLWYYVNKIFTGVATINNIVAQTVGRRFYGYCSACKPVEVLCVFDKAVNLKVGGGILSIVSAGTGRSRSSLMVNNLGGLGLMAGETGLCKPGSVEFDRIIIDFEHSPVWDGLLDKDFRRELRRECVYALKAALDRHVAAGQSGTTNSAWRVGPDSRLRQGIAELSDRPEDAVRKLIGLGPGLTPSGDDVLLGYLAVLNHYAGGAGGSDDTNSSGSRSNSSGHNSTRDSNDTGNCGGKGSGKGSGKSSGKGISSHVRTLRDTIGDAIGQRLGATTDLSAQLLENAIRCEYHEYVESLLIALCGRPEEVFLATDNLLGMGATSGSDITTGMYYASELLLRNN